MRHAAVHTTHLYQGKALDAAAQWYYFGSRWYDARLGLWNATDPAGQMASPYTAMGGNPVVYVDPDGEFILTVMLTSAVLFGAGNLYAHHQRGEAIHWDNGLKYFAQGAVAGAALGAAGYGLWAGASLMASSSIPWVAFAGNASKLGMQAMAYTSLATTALSIAGGIYQSHADPSKTTFHNAFSLLAGNFYLDENKGFMEGVKEGFSRFTWQLPQQFAGYNTAQATNAFGGTRSVSYYGGATVSQTYDYSGGITMGNHILGNKGIEADPSNSLFQHEYGHYIQSQSWGLFYFSKFGIPSLLSKDPHNAHPAEQDANIRGRAYFYRHEKGNYMWDKNKNKIFSYSKRLNVSFFDIVLSPLNILPIPAAGMIIPGLINAGYYNTWY